MLTDQQSFSLDGGRVEQPGQSCSEDKERDHDEKQAVDEAGQHLHTIIATQAHTDRHIVLLVFHHPLSLSFQT